MSDTYENFMIYELDDSGERAKLDVTEDQFRENNGSNVLHSAQVVVIVKEDLRRIYIWKGAKSPVRKRFISSRVASALQEELINLAAFHRCKIVSVDQGDEVNDFLNAFHFESMAVEEKLADMRYIRNVEREKMIDQGIVPDTSPKVVKVEKKEETYVSPALQEMQKTKSTQPPPKPQKSVPKPKSSAPAPKPRSITPTHKQTYQPPPMSTKSSSQQSIGLSEDEQKSIKEKILNNEVPEGFKRQNLVLGHTLYGAVTKKVNVFGKSIEEAEWDKVTNLPKDTIEIDTHKIRVYFNQEKGIVEAIEILQDDDKIISSPSKKTVSKKSDTNEPIPKKPVKEEEITVSTELVDYNSWTVKELKNYCSTHSIDLPTSARKADIINFIKEFNNGSSKGKSTSSRRRELPKIPSKTK